MKDVRMCVERLLKNSFNVGGSQLESWTNTLTEKTNGFFLYFRFLSEMLQDSGNLTDEAVNMMPVGLEGMYSAHCLKLLGTLGREKYERALGAVLACRGPLPEIVWRKVMGVAENETGYIELQKSLNNLLLFGNGGVEIVHRSIREWIITEGEYIGEVSALGGSVNDRKQGEEIHVSKAQGIEALYPFVADLESIGKEFENKFKYGAAEMLFETVRAVGMKNPDTREPTAKLDGCHESNVQYSETRGNHDTLASLNSIAEMYISHNEYSEPCLMKLLETALSLSGILELRIRTSFMRRTSEMFQL